MYKFRNAITSCVTMYVNISEEREKTVFCFRSESESEVLFILGQPLAHRATIKVPSKKKYNNRERKRVKTKTKYN